jgi:hypothetical protein
MAVKDEQRIPPTIRQPSPCKGCTERFIACSDHCPKDLRGEYGIKAWKADLEAVKQKKKAFVETWNEDMRRSKSNGV